MSAAIPEKQRTVIVLYRPEPDRAVPGVERTDWTQRLAVGTAPGANRSAIGDSPDVPRNLLQTEVSRNAQKHFYLEIPLNAPAHQDF